MVVIQEEMHVLHLCGVPNCLNPHHLCWGSPSANATMAVWHKLVGKGLVFWRDSGEEKWGIAPSYYNSQHRERP